MKYIMFESVDQDGLTRAVPVIFPDFLVHAEVAGRLRGLVPGITRVVSAGTALVNVDATTEGSETLGVRARDKDSRIINMYDYLHGIET